MDFLFILRSECQSCECLKSGGWIVLLGHEKRASESIKYTHRECGVEYMAYPLAAVRLKFQRHPKCFNLRNMETLSRRTNIYFTLFFSLYSDLILQQEKATQRLPNVGSVTGWQNTLGNLLQYIFLGYAHAITAPNICTWLLSRIHISFCCVVLCMRALYENDMFLDYTRNIFQSIIHTQTRELTKYEHIEHVIIPTKHLQWDVLPSRLSLLRICACVGKPRETESQLSLIR